MKPPKPHHIESCARKINYGSRKEAKGAAVAMRRKKPGEYFHAYRCSVCLQWHIGHDYDRGNAVKREPKSIF